MANEPDEDGHRGSDSAWQCTCGAMWSVKNFVLGRDPVPKCPSAHLQGIGHRSTLIGAYAEGAQQPKGEQPSQGKRFNADKMRPSLISPFALWMLGKVLQFGAKKYAPHNWTKGLSWEETCDSLQRHYLKFLMGEELDEESQLPHVAHLFCNTMFLVHMHVTGTGKDDRGFVAFKLSEQYRKFFTQQAHPQSEEKKAP